MGANVQFMGILKTLAFAATAGGIAAGAAASERDDRLAAFATCSGRWSAVMEHEWLMGRDGEDARHHRRGFLDLLDATRTAQDDGPALLNQRIMAKHALSRLLQQADLGLDPMTARRAGAMARRHLGACSAMILG